LPPVTGIFILAELTGPAAEQVHALQLRYDPKLARSTRPHVTVAGSSGMGPIERATTPEALRQVLAPIAADTPPLVLPFGPPQRFMQTEIVSLPLDPHGPLRALHERIKTSGLRYAQPRFSFSPHVTLSFYPTLTPTRARELLALRVSDPAEIRTLAAYRHRDPLPPVKLVEVELAG
jgi:2'-5' RNA ligase